MTTKDTAGDKLVASIRKTKTGTEAATPTVRKKVVKKTAQRKAKKVVPAKPAENTGSNKKELVNLFHSGRRVWPD